MRTPTDVDSTWPVTVADKAMMTKLGREIFREIVEYDTATGNLDPTPENILKLICSLKKKIKAGRMSWNVATDFRSTLLRLARVASSKEDWEMSCMYYGTWLEHQLNNLLHLWIIRIGGKNQDGEILMKESSPRGKFLWLHLCVTGRTAPVKQFNKLIALSDRRNQFVHYKWKMRDIDEDTDGHYKNATKGAEGLVRYFAKFEQKHFLKKSRTFFRKI